jgi:uncharacterized protein YndB with AHSA1/START domain
MSDLRFSISRAVDAPAADVWRVLCDFGSEHRWVRNLERCELDTPTVRVGSFRTCRLARPLMGRTEVREEVTEFEPGAALAYRLEGPAGPFEKASSRWSTRAGEGGSTVVTIEGRFAASGWLTRFLVWPLARTMLSRMTRQVIGELENFVIAQRAAGRGAR